VHLEILPASRSASSLTKRVLCTGKTDQPRPLASVLALEHLLSLSIKLGGTKDLTSLLRVGDLCRIHLETMKSIRELQPAPGLR